MEEETSNSHKLASERANAESKIKSLEEQVTFNEDNIAKVSALRVCVCVCVCVCVHVRACACV